MISFARDDIFYYGIVALASWIIGWYIVYLVSGFHLKSIGINNGVLFNGVSYTSRRINVKLRSFRIRLWGNSRKLVLDDLEITLHSRDAAKSKKEHKKSEDPLDGAIDLKVLPSNWIARLLVLFIIRHMPSIDIGLKHTTIFYPDSTTTTVEYLRFMLDSRFDKKSSIDMKLCSTLVLNEVKNSSGTHSRRLVPPMSLHALKLQVNFMINMKRGNAHNIEVKLFTDEFKCFIFRSAKDFIDRIRRDIELNSFGDDQDAEFTETNTSKGKNLEQNGAGSSKLPKRLDTIIRLRNMLYPAIKEISFSLDNSELLEIPFASIEDEMLFVDAENHSQKYSLDLISKSISFNYLKLDENSTGYHVLFDSHVDSPFQINIAIQMLRVNYCTLNTENNQNTNRRDEILNIPNFSYIYKSNIIDCLVKGQGLKDCVTEFAASACSPMIDLTTAQLSMFIYNCVVFKKYLALKQLKKKKMQIQKTTMKKSVNYNHFSENIEDLDETQVESDNDNDFGKTTESTLNHKLYNLLRDYFPKVDSKFVIEQPRFIIRHHDRETNKLQILDFSYSLLNLHNLTTPERNFNINCHIIHPCVNFLQKSTIASETVKDDLIKKEIFSFRSINLKFNILKTLQVKSTIAITEPVIDLSQLDIITGINDLLQDITCMAIEDLSTGLVNLKLDSSIMKLKSTDPMIETTSTNKLQLEQKIFRYLPQWLLDIDLSISKLTFVFGSRSVLIDKDNLDQIDEEGYNMDYLPANHKLRTLRFIFDNLNMTVKNNIYDSECLLNSNINSSDSLTLNENTTVYWTTDLQISKAQLALQILLNKSDKIDEELLSIPLMDISVSAINSDELNSFKVNANIEEVTGSYDRYKLFVLIGAIYLMREAILTPIKLIKNRLRRDMEKVTNNQLPKVSGNNKKIKDFMVMNCNIKRANIVLHLNDDCKIKLQLFEILGVIDKGVVSLNNKFFRILADSPFVKGYWCRIACADNLLITTNDPASISKINIVSDSIRLIQPHGFVTYKLFDNISITIKILKYLVSCLKPDFRNQGTIDPKESKALKLPETNIKLKKLSFCMEDDPFECELNMIYQLGIVEQRKRLEQISLFESKVEEEENYNKDYNKNKFEIDEKIYLLRKSMSTSWIRKVKVYKSKLHEEIIQNKKYLFGNEASSPIEKNEKILGYMNQAPLLSIILSGIDLDLSTTKFDLTELPKFIHDVGQGVPLATRYSLMIPMFLKVQLSELRMHLRDYPLPLLHVPSNKDRTASLSMAGHLIIAEALINEIKHMRNLHIPLLPDVKNQDKHHSLTINKTLSTVKLFTDLKIDFTSTKPSRFVWGQSYQFGIQQVMLNFDQFSKPPVDPSLKLGFWDKLRFIVHGKFRIHTGPQNNLEAAFKGSRDPYELSNVSSGFVLAFNDNVEWTINENDDSRLFLKVKSDKVMWYIPNYLAMPLISWSRDTSKYTFFPNSKSFTTSCFAYYLEDVSLGDSDTIVPQSRIYEKKVVCLKGGVNFIVGFLLQRDTKSGISARTIKHHYDIRLFNPYYTQEGHDSYAGFRSDYINMSISLHANTNDNYNSIHLSPGTFRQFFSWWKLFAGNMMLPIRRGNLFGDSKKSVKFSQHLFTNKFQFNFKSLFLSHMYRDENVDTNGNSIECVGIRAKMDEFLVDLHQVKEPRIMVHEGLSLNKKIKKMNFRLGEVHLTGIDLRTVHAQFDQNIYSHKGDQGNRKPRFKVFDNDGQWFDIEDYEEAFMLSLRKSRRSVKMYPLMYSKRFSYLRDTTKNSAEVINMQEEENTHNCLLGSKNTYNLQIDLLQDRIRQLEERIEINTTKNIPNEQLYKRIDSLNSDIEEKKLKQHNQNNEKDSSMDTDSNFHNKFVIVCMFLKWNVQNRNLLYKYIHFVQLKVRLRKYLSYESIRALHEIIDKNSAELGDDISIISQALEKMKLQKSTSEISKKSQSSQQRLKDFDSIIHTTDENKRISEDFLIEILYPQIQLQNNDTPNTIVLVAAPSIDAKIVSVLSKSNDQLVINERELEKRYGAVLKDANIFVLNQEDLLNVNKLILNKRTYGSTTNWPPWLGIEICKNGKIAGEEKLIVEKTSMLFTYEQLYPQGQLITDVNESMYESIDNDIEIVPRKINVDIPELKIKSTARQYHSLYLIVLNLLLYVEPESKSLSDKLEKLKLSIDFLDLVALKERIVNLHKYYRLMNFLTNNYAFKHDKLDNEQLNEYLMIDMERGNTITEIYLLMNSLLTGELFNNDYNNQTIAEWNINADRIHLCMLEDDRKPIVDLLMDHGKYRRRANENGSNDNRIEIAKMEGRNLLKNAYYEKLIEPLDVFNMEDCDAESKNMITVEWCLKRSVGGIKVLDNFLIDSQPLNIKIDEITGEKLLNYVFPSGSEDHSVGNNLDDDIDSDEQTSDNEDEGMRPEGFVEALDGTNKSVTFQDDHEVMSDKVAKKHKASDKHISRISNAKLQISSLSSSNEEADENLDQMVERSKKYLSIGNFNISPIYLLISVKCNSGYKRILNVNDLFIKLPAFSIGNEILSFLEVTMKIKKMIKKALLKHIGRLLKNKLGVKKNSFKRGHEHLRNNQGVVDELITQ